MQTIKLEINTYELFELLHIAQAAIEAATSATKREPTETWQAAQELLDAIHAENKMLSMDTLNKDTDATLKWIKNCKELEDCIRRARVTEETMKQYLLAPEPEPSSCGMCSHGQPTCTAKHDHLMCTRERNHEGMHVACGETTHLLHTWEPTEAEALASFTARANKEDERFSPHPLHDLDNSR